MNTEIFIPMYYMVLLTTAVFLLSTIIRFKDVLVDKGHSGSELMKIPLPTSANDLMKQADRNLANLFEFPILFYAACVVIYVSGKVDDFFILLAYIFVGLRVLHSIYHIFINGFIGDMPTRALIWLPSLVIVIWIWVRLISMF